MQHPTAAASASASAVPMPVGSNTTRRRSDIGRSPPPPPRPSPSQKCSNRPNRPMRPLWLVLWIQSLVTDPNSCCCCCCFLLAPEVRERERGREKIADTNADCLLSLGRDFAGINSSSQAVHSSSHTYRDRQAHTFLSLMAQRLREDDEEQTKSLSSLLFDHYH